MATATMRAFLVLPPVRRWALVYTQVLALAVAKKAIKKSDIQNFGLIS